MPPTTSVLNVNSLTSNIAPASGSGNPGILFFSSGAGDLTLNSATGPFKINISQDFVDGIVATSGGAVNVTTSGNISIKGLFANGINVSSFAGGAVNVASSSDISLAQGGTGITAFTDGTLILASKGAISITGDGTGIDATAGTGVTVNSSGPISITGAGDAIDASDIGGATVGGGVTVISSGAISLAGNAAIAINAVSEDTDPVSVASSSNISLTNGGAGIVATSNGAVTVNSSGGISVAGSSGGTGIVAASGGAGTASVTSSGVISIAGDGAAIVAVSAGGAANVASSGNIFVGGSGAAISAIGVTATVSSSGGISIGGKGSAISAISFSGAANVTSTGSVSIGGEAEGAALSAVSVAGGAANITSSGNIVIGGGGGIGAAGSVVQVNSSGNISVKNSGTGISAVGVNGVTVSSSGAISIAGNGNAIDAESPVGAANINSSGKIIIGGSGIGISAKGGLVGITTSGDVSAPGNASVGIEASTPGRDIAVKIAGGTITGGSGTGAGIVLIGGANNTLTNLGTITTSPGLAGTAILGMPTPGAPPTAIGNNTVNNSGTVIGNVDLGPGRNAFNNLPGGTFNSGATVKLGSGNPLNNSGNLSPGGSGVIQTTALTGNLVQGSAGKISVDINPGTGQADRINASGSAKLAGQVALNLLNLTPTIGATASTLVQTGGGVTNNGLALGALPAVVAYQLEFPNGNDVVLQGGLNFAPAGLNSNQAAIGQSINAIQLAGGSPKFLPIVQAILTIPDVSSLGQAYNQLSPETYADNEIADFYSGLRFANSLMSCKVSDGGYAFIKEGQCAWAQIGGNFLNLDATSGSLPFHESAVVISGGAEVMLRPDWFASFALGYDNGSASTGNALTTAQAERAHFGAAIKYNPGPFLLSAAIFGGYGWYSTDRLMNFGDFNATASSDSRTSRVGGQFRAAYLIDRKSWYLKPILDLNITRVNLNGFSEQGAGGANLIVSSAGETVFSASPAVEIGTQTNLQNGSLFRPFAKLGISAFSNTDFAVNAAFGGAPVGVAPFRVATGINSLTADVAAGADLFLPDSRYVFKLAYNGHYGARVRDQGFTLKASIRF